jgi:hypothetical protein|tara:strand:+ start:62 stop:412 length:351 start_codon:yes stop_codon:yes gene_type:complete
MASTRNKNTRENYNIEKQELRLQTDFMINNNFSNNDRTYFPDFGLNPSQLPREQLSQNSVEVESALFGINATNLENPRAPLKDQQVNMDYVRFFDKPELIMPGDLVLEGNQRPLRK